MDTMQNKLATLPRAARAVGVTVHWLRTETKAGRVPCLQAGINRYLFDIETLSEFLRERAKRLPIGESSTPQTLLPGTTDI